MSAVPQYTGSVQPQGIQVAATVPLSEDGPEVMPPNPYQEQGMAAAAVILPPLYKTDIWTSMQTWPL